MKIFTRVAFLFLTFFAVTAGQEAKAQLTMTPLDTLYTYNSKATLGTVTNPNQPATGKIGKWIRTVRMSWNTNEYKAYIFNGTDFRIHFPHTYNPVTPNGKRYPIIVFYHGDGEDGTIYDNEDQLDHGAQPFQSEIDAGGFDGYALFIQTQYGFGVANDLNIQALVDSLVTYYQGDPYRVIQNGLSGGGQGEWNNLVAAPTYFGASIPMSAALTADATPADVQMLRWTPIWNLDGGLDNDPPPYTAQLVASYFLGAGSNYIYHNFTTLGHDTWDSTWLLPNFWPFCNSIYQSNPWPLFGRTNFCPGQTIKVTIGVVPGMAGYVWRKNGVVIPGATADTLAVTAAGTYDCQIKRGNYYWSDFSHTPVVITVQGSTQTPPITTVNGESAVLPDAAGDTTVTLQLPTGDSIYTWKYLPTGQTVGTSPTLTVGASKAGDYTGSIIPYQGCSSIPSPAFPVVKATGPNPPPSATTLVGTPTGFTTVRLTWSAAPNPTYPPTAYEVYRGNAPGVYKLIAQAAYDSLAYTDGTVTAGHKYYYVVRAVDTTGAAALSNIATVLTAGDVTPPTAPSNLVITGTTNTSAALSWGASTDNVGVDHYAVYVNGNLAGVTQNLTFIVAGLNTGQVYAFVVKAVDASGNYSNSSDQVSANIVSNGLSYRYYTTPNAWTALPTFTTLIPQSVGSMPAVSIAGSAGQENYAYVWTGYITVPVTGTYTFSTTSDGGSALWFNSLTPTGATTTATVNNDGSHTSRTVTSKSLSLTAGVYPICIEYYHGATGTGTMSVLWASKQAFGNTLSVAVAAKYFAGSTTPPGAVPAKPTGVQALATSYNSVNITWTDTSSIEAGFEVYRTTALNGGGIWQIVGTTPANSTSYTDASVSPSTKYYYRVQAINANGGSGYDTASMGGLSYNFYQGTFDPLINYDSAGTAIVSSGNLNNFSLSPAGSLTSNFGLLFAGMIRIPVTGTWTFSLNSEDASELFINGYKWANVVVNNNFQSSTTTRSGTITLNAGTYPIYVSYEQTSGTEAFTVSWANSAAHIAQAAIPDSAFANANWTATTFALPAAPVTPTILKDSLIGASKVYFSWQDTTSSLTGYTLYRSQGDSLHFNILSQPGANVTQYTDTALFGHTTYYYHLVANGAGGSSAPVTFSATTPDNAPVFAAIASPQFLNYTKTGTVNVNVTDVDGDVITLTASNLPSFANFTPGTANGTGTLTFTPASQTSNEGSFPGITLTANDNHGDIVTDTFTLIVNNNVPPVFNPVKNDTLNAGSSLAVPITVTDGNPSNVLTFSFTGLPANSVLSPGANGTDTLKLNPNYGDAGSYTVVATVNDGNGGITSASFHVVINKVSPSQNVYVQFSAGDVAGTPWNVMSGSGTATNFLDSHGNKTTVGLNFQPGWWITYNNGPVTGNNSGIYPDKVEEDYFFFGSYPGVFTGPSTDSVQVTGLNPSQTYSLTFYSGSVWVVLPNNGTTTYTCQGQSGSLAVQDNTQNTVTFSGLQPNANGIVTFTLGLGANTQVGYLNAVVISSTFNDGTAPLSPSNLAAGLAGNGAVQLNWYDSAYNETGYYVLRSQSPTGPFVQLTRTAGAGVTSYVDSTSGSNRTYYYEVQAFNSNGQSNPSNIASVTTADRVPTINPIANVNMTYSQTQTVTITTNADTTNMVSLTATGLPPFATFTDNGNGTATLTITPSQGASGVFPTVTVTSTDQMDSVRTATFSIIVRDPSVTSTYVHLSDGTQLGGTPWNNFPFWPSAGNGMGSLVNDAGVTTSMAFTFKNGMAGSYVGGMQPHNGAGIYPDPVMRSGDYESGSQIDTITLSGLQQGQAYNIVFFNSVDYGGSGITNYYVNGKTVALNPNYNINNTVRINDVLPNASGVIYLGVQKVSGQTYAYLNDFIVENYDSATHLLAPTGLIVKAMNTASVTLQWQVRSSGETGEQVWRGTDSAGSSYQLIATLAPGTSSFVDNTVKSNRNYYYVVASVDGTTESNLSNVVYANPYAYLIYLSYSVPYTAPAPWNNNAILPTLGQVWYNFLDANGNVTNVGQVQTGTWGGEYAGGMQTGNNSGVVPDAVMIASYGLFPGTTGAVQLTGLDMNMTYDLTFFGSANLGGDNNATYTANGGEAILNATLNETGEVTIFNVAPDVHGNINITCTPSDPQSQFGLMNAVILQGHSLAPSGNTPTVPAGATTITTAQTGTAMALVNTDSSQTTKPLNAYPNPFHDQFTLQVPAETMNENVVVTIFDVTGKALYQKEFDNLTQGNNYLLITPMAAEHDGVYFVRVLYSDKKTVKIIKMIRQ